MGWFRLQKAQLIADYYNRFSFVFFNFNCHSAGGVKERLTLILDF
jgi:hypothetical protein